jgi:hypothetical protein
LLGEDRGITEPPGPYVEHGAYRPVWGFPGRHRHFVMDSGFGFDEDVDDDSGAAPIPPGWEDDA